MNYSVMQNHCFFEEFVIFYKNVLCWPLGIELKHLCLEYMTPWLRNLVRFCKHNDDAKRQRVTAILDKLITMTINEKQMYPSIQAKIWGSLGQVGPSNPHKHWLNLILRTYSIQKVSNIFSKHLLQQTLQWYMTSKCNTPVYFYSNSRKLC